MDNQTELQLKILELQGELIESLPQRLSRLDDLWHQYTQTRCPEAIQEMLRETHTLKGTCGSFGLALIAEQAETLEQALSASPLIDETIQACLSQLSTTLANLVTA